MKKKEFSPHCESHLMRPKYEMMWNTFRKLKRSIYIDRSVYNEYTVYLVK